MPRPDFPRSLFSCRPLSEAVRGVDLLALASRSSRTTGAARGTPDAFEARVPRGGSGALGPWFALALGAVSFGCAKVPPPKFPAPSATELVQEARLGMACGTGIQAQASIDAFGKDGRVRGDMMLLASAPDRMRMDVVVPFGAAVMTLTSDGKTFALADLRQKLFFRGDPTPCNIARFTHVALPGHVLVSLLRGEVPRLAGESEPSELAWNSKGYYTVTRMSPSRSRETFHLGLHPDDVAKPWGQQRFRLLHVDVSRQGRMEWEADLDEYASAPMATPRIDPDGIDAPLPPSGPVCTAEAPRRLHLQVPETDSDVRMRYREVTWNPPLPAEVFEQATPDAMTERWVRCF